MMNTLPGKLLKKVSQSITARSLKLGQLIEEEESWINWCNFKKKESVFFRVIAHFDLGIENL